MLRSFAVKLGIILSAFLGAALGPASPSARADLIDATYGVGAGSFELGHYGGGAYDAQAPGSTTIVGWTVGGPGDGVDWLTQPYFNADTGSKSIDLKHLTDSSISTVLPTEIGATYQLSFAAAAVLGDDNAGKVSAGSLVDQAFAPPFSAFHDYAGQVYKDFTFLFTALDTSTTVRFEAVGHLSPPGAEYGPVLDSVSVNFLRSVPEPSSVLLVGAGFASILLYGLRRRSPAKAPGAADRA